MMASRTIVPRSAASAGFESGNEASKTKAAKDKTRKNVSANGRGKAVEVSVAKEVTMQRLDAGKHPPRKPSGANKTGLLIIGNSNQPRLRGAFDIRVLAGFPFFSTRNFQAARNAPVSTSSLALASRI